MSDKEAEVVTFSPPPPVRYEVEVFHHGLVVRRFTTRSRPAIEHGGLVVSFGDVKIIGGCVLVKEIPCGK